MNLKEQVQQMDAMVAKGAIVDAVKTYFCDQAKTSDYGNTTTSGKDQMVAKMEGFVGSIAKVKEIKHHQTTIGESVSASEFTFNFDMQDGSEILWHEIIRREWNNDGKVINESYFKAN